MHPAQLHLSFCDKIEVLGLFVLLNYFLGDGEGKGLCVVDDEFKLIG
jgi:hypothetical protein